MKKTKRLLIIGLLIFPMCLPGALAQNVYIEVLDIDTYRPLPDVRVEMESSSTRITFYTSPAGSINENVPAGEYTVTLTHYGYETLVEHGVLIRTYERNLYTFRLRSKAIDVSRYPDDQKKEAEALLTHEPPLRKLYTGLGYQGGNMQAIKAGLGYYISRELNLSVQYSYSKQAYSSIFFADQQGEQDVLFHKAWFGLEYNYMMQLSKDAGIYGGPGLGIGIEATSSKDLVSHPDINFMLSPALRPGLQGGLYYKNVALHFGVEYIAWVFNVMNQDMKPIERGTDGEPLSWSEDLFKERKGLGISAGIRFFF